MPLWKIAWRSIQRRGLASALTAFSMALGVMLVVAVLVIHGIVEESFRANSSLGYNMIVGANKGGKLQIVLNSVFYLSEPAENIRDYNFYLDFLGKEERGDGKDGKWKNFVSRVVPICLGDYYRQFRVVGTTPDMLDFDDDEGNPMYPFASGRNFKTWSDKHGFFEAVVGARVARTHHLKVGDDIIPTHGSEEGEEHDKFVVVGVLEPTGTPGDRAVFVNMEGFFLLDGHAKRAEKNTVADAVIGAKIASRLNLDVGSDMTLSHASPTGDQDDNLRVVEVLDPTGTRDDEAMFVQPPKDDENASTADTSRVAKNAEPEDGAFESAHLNKTTPLPAEQREVTALLIRTINPFVTPGMVNTINEGTQAQAVLPVKEITSLFESIVSPIRRALLAMTAMICLVSGISILVSIYNSMSDRNREIAIMRSLGAGRRTVMVVVLLEAVILSVGGGLVGWIGGHAAIGVASSKIENETGVRVGMFDLAPAPLQVRYSETVMNLEKLTNESGKKILDVILSPELLLIPIIILLAVIVGFLPAITAYKTDVAKSLSANP